MIEAFTYKKEIKFHETEEGIDAIKEIIVEITKGIPEIEKFTFVINPSIPWNCNPLKNTKEKINEIINNFEREIKTIYPGVVIRSRKKPEYSYWLELYLK